VALLSSSYLAPGAREPFNAILTGAAVADLRVCRPLAATSFQREAADVVGQAENSPGSYTHPTFCRALWGKKGPQLMRFINQQPGNQNILLLFRKLHQTVWAKWQTNRPRSL